MRQTWKACLLAAFFVLTALSTSAQTPAKTSSTIQKKAASAKILNQAQQTQGISQEQTELKQSRSQTATASSQQTAPCKKPMARINASTGKVTILNKKTHKKN